MASATGCSRLVAHAGRMRLRPMGRCADSGLQDVIVTSRVATRGGGSTAEGHRLLLGSRYCEMDRAFRRAGNLFEKDKPGWARGPGDWRLSYGNIARLRARPARPWTVVGSVQRGQALCRDYAHWQSRSAVAMNITADIGTGYLGDIGMPPALTPRGICRSVRGHISAGRWLHLCVRATTFRGSAVS